MTTTSAARSPFAKRYAHAYIASVPVKDQAKTAEEIQSFLAIIKDSKDLQEVISNPLFSNSHKSEILKNLGTRTKMSEMLQHFLQTILKNGRLSALPVILQTVLKQIDAMNGVIDAQVESAYPLSAAQEKEIEAKITKLTGGKARISAKTNESLIGGLVMTIGSKRIDGSVKRRLELLGQDLKRDPQTNPQEQKKA